MSLTATSPEIGSGESLAAWRLPQQSSSEITLESDAMAPGFPGDSSQFRSTMEWDELVMVQVTADSTFTPGLQQRLFSMANYLSGSDHHQYDVSPDDSRFVMLRIEEEASASPPILVENWEELLEEQVPN